MEKIASQQDEASNYIGIRSQAECEAEVEELNSQIEKLQTERELWETERAAHQEQLYSAQHSIAQLEVENRQLNEELLQALRENMRYRHALAAQQRSQQRPDPNV